MLFDDAIGVLNRHVVARKRAHFGVCLQVASGQGGGSHRFFSSGLLILYLLTAETQATQQKMHKHMQKMHSQSK
jgi:hypothetical protein